LNGNALSLILSQKRAFFLITETCQSAMIVPMYGNRQQSMTSFFNESLSNAGNAESLGA